jgi:hypothetical protein
VPLIKLRCLRAVSANFGDVVHAGLYLSCLPLCILVGGKR